MKHLDTSLATGLLAALMLAGPAWSVSAAAPALAAAPSSAAAASTPLSADEALAAALARPEPRLRWSAEARRAQAGLVRARTWSNPALAFSRERVDDAPGVPTERSLVLSQDFDLSGRRALEIEAARADIDATRLGVASEQLDWKAELLRRFHAAALAAARLQAAEAQREEFARLAQTSAKRLAAGDLSALEARRIELRLAAAEVEQILRLGEQDRARAALGLLVGAETALRPLLPAPLPETIDARGDVGREATAALATRFAAARRDLAQVQARAARRWSLPVTVGVGVRRTEVAGRSDDAAVFELSLPLPLFDRRHAEAEAAAATLELADAQAREAENAARAAGAVAHAEARRLLAELQRLRTQRLPAAQRMAASARGAYAEGELELVELLDALEAHAALVDASLDLEHRARLAFIEIERLSPAPSVLME